MNHAGIWSDASSPASFAGYGEGAPLDVSDIDPAAIAARFRDGTIHDLGDALARVGNCAHPIRLRGSSHTVDRTTGEVLSAFDSRHLPGQELHVPCGNRRASKCPACSRVYARDTFELIRAGVAGGKQVPESVADNPMVFLTLTAPSFGHVHSTRGGKRCRPRDKAHRCEHGRPVGCMAKHTEDDPAVGAPICPDCYDLDTAIVWQWFAPELWRRFTMAMRRAVAAHLGLPESRLKDAARVQYAKVAEPQRRGAIHFHALIRLDGPADHGIGAPAPETLAAANLADLAQQAVRQVVYTAPPIDADDGARLLRFGAQVDAHAVRAGSRTDAPGEHLSAEQVAGYIAKYSTKDAGASSATAYHLRVMEAQCESLHARAVAAEGEESPYLLLRKWAHMLGFRGHFSSKSRSYSVTLGSLRRARHRWQQLAAESRRTGEPLDTADLERRLLADEDEDTTLVVGSWTYVGSGWRNESEEALALAAAGRAREYQQWRAEQKTR
ncbi:replication initiator [Janibacter hoylei]|uniref:replication initiator n=1 Tax=Janibacter hoylei TaxID=364298 RepID=UPI0027BA3AED|nr:replication initiator [Janibacter hoylei]